MNGMLIFKNGEIKEFRNKLNHEHILAKPNLLPINKYEIYSVVKNNETTKIGDLSEQGIVSEFFIDNDEIYIRYANILKKYNDIQIKKKCIKL